MERADVKLSGHQHPAPAVHPCTHPGLRALARLEVLAVDPVEELHGPADVLAPLDNVRTVHNALVGTGLREQIRIGAGGKIATGTDLVNA
jgi:hypothetical protein